MDAALQSRRNLPPLAQVIAATAVVAVLPSLVAGGLRLAGALSPLAAVIVAPLLSFLLSYLGGLYWRHRRGSSEALFAEVMLWGWTRRRRIETRLSDTIKVLGFHSGNRSRGTIDLSPERRLELFKQLAIDLQASDPYMDGHSKRVARYATLMGLEMGLTQQAVARLHTAALLHDVGKLYTPREILHKPGSLSDDEFAVIKRHSRDGARMIRLMVGADDLASIVLHHHERFDGGGYPSGLSGELIPLESRIIAVADTFDAIVSHRAYRPAMPHKLALGILRREAGAQLDPGAVRAFLTIYHGREPMPAVAAFSAVLEGLIPNLTASGVRFAGIAAGTAALATSGLTAPWGFHSDRGAHPGVTSALASGPAFLPPLGVRPYLSVPRSSGSTTPVARQPRRGSHSGLRAPAGTTRGRGHHPTTTPGGSAAGANPPSAAGSGPPRAAGSPPPSTNGGSPPPSGGGGNGGGGPVTVTTGGSGVGVNVNAGGTSAGVGLNTSTNPSVGVTVGSSAGRPGAGVGVSVPSTGTPQSSGTVTVPGLP